MNPLMRSSMPFGRVLDMLELCALASDDILIDLGSGDGRIPILGALLFGISRTIGVESDDLALEESSRRAGELGLSEGIEFLHRDMFSLDLGEFDVITIFQSQDAVERLALKLQNEVHDGARIVSYLIPLGGLSPLRMLKPARIEYPFYVYSAPLKFLDESESVRLLKALEKFGGASEIEWCEVWASRVRSTAMIQPGTQAEF